MVSAFFTLAMTAPNRQIGFRRVVALHVGLLTLCALILMRNPIAPIQTAIAYMMLVLGIVEGAALIGWRLTQLPKSQALEFLLVSSLQPRPVFVAEATVGILRFALVCLSGLPILVLLRFGGTLLPGDIVPLLVMPFISGVVAGLGLTAWVYESARIRRVGEVIAIIGVMVYLIVGVMAGERLRNWLQAIPPEYGAPLFHGFQFMQAYNPFGIMQYWFDVERDPLTAWQRQNYVIIGCVLLAVLFGLRGAFRLKAHFHDRHYKPIDSSRKDQSAFIGDRPLSWWAVRRVMEYSGRVNLWLAGGFSILYALYIVAGNHWPSWMGQSAFTFFNAMGGVPMLATAMIILASVPAAFQYGLWDPSVQDRCRRLELLLLTELRGIDYWHAACAAALKRGQGYFIVALILWSAYAIAGSVTWLQVVAAFSAGVLLWSFSFALGFRAFASGTQANGLGSILTIGMPILTVLLVRSGFLGLAGLLPTGSVYLAIREPLTWRWLIGPIILAIGTLWLARVGLVRCEDDLRRWYDRNQGTKSVI